MNVIVLLLLINERCRKLLISHMKNSLPVDERILGVILNHVPEIIPRDLLPFNERKLLS